MPRPIAPEVELRRYMYGDLQYPSLVTSGDYDGRVLLHSDAGVVAGEHKYQSGSVLFVNLPLGYLKGNTDGLPLHGFLEYFAEHTLGVAAPASGPRWNRRHHSQLARKTRTPPSSRFRKWRRGESWSKARTQFTSLLGPMPWSSATKEVST